jgi:putative DNA primase/helicase
MAKPRITQKEVDLLRACYARLGSSNRDERRKVWRHIIQILRQHYLTWGDLLATVTVSTSLDPRYHAEDLRRLHELHDLLASGDDVTRDVAVKRIGEILERYRIRWTDVLDLIAGVTAGAPDPSRILHSPRPSDTPNPLDLLTTILPDIMDITEDEITLTACWIPGSYIYRQFRHFPRLVFQSPVRGCGKTTGLKVLNSLCANPHKTDNITSSAIFHMIDSRSSTLLLDEADNLGLYSNATIRAVLNSGHEVGGTFDRVVPRQGTYSYSTYAPVALAAIGLLPLPLMDRSWTIHMVRTKKEMPLQLHRPKDLEQLEFVRNEILNWVQGRQFDLDPPLPWKSTSRRCDNARPLVAIADACGEQWGQIVRNALVRLSKRFRDEDLHVTLLRDIREVFNKKGVDRIRSRELVAELIEMDEAPWSEFRGVRDDQQPRQLTATAMAGMLLVFRPPIGPIKPRTLRFYDEGTDSGYLRLWFEGAWHAFCDEEVTRSQPSLIKGLLGS